MFQKIFGDNRNKKTPDWVVREIREARENQLEELYLAGFGRSKTITTIPEEVFKLTGLRKLTIIYTEITTIPEAITRLRNLEILDLNNNKIDDIPAYVGSLPHLKELNIEGNPLFQIPDWITERTDWIMLGLGNDYLTEVPTWLSQQTNLKRLELTGKRLASLPAWFSNLKNIENLRIYNAQFPVFPGTILHLTNLKSLTLLGCNLTEIPETISSLAKLKTLNLRFNFLSTLPASLKEIKNLSNLALGSNRFREIPECVFHLKSLENLEFYNYYKDQKQENSISEIPLEIIQLDNLSNLDMRGNPVTTPPEEIVTQGINAIREYYRQAQEQGTDELYEAKLLLVGEPGAGKTSLAHKILDPEYILKPKEPSTKGIDVSPWRFPMATGREFRVNLWDFGGQEIYHATHQYFLTKRSLYVLVADTRQEDTDYEFWLNVIELLGGDSPVLIIKNEKQERKRDLDERYLRGRFPNLKEILSTNLETNRGLDRIRETIQYHLHHLPHIGSPLPKSWVKVRASLENDPRNTISLDEYLQVCRKNGFENRADALQLSGYLHDLGVFLHFQEDAVLKHLVILKTQWGTDAAYNVLDNPTVINNLGQFTRNDLRTIWDRPEYQGMYDELLQLMIKFRLCYRVPGAPDHYMAPQLLSLNQPEYIWDENENLYMRYSYDFMPKGMLIQLIVALHERIAGDNLVWRTGVVLEDESGLTRAEVTEQYQKREIHIRVSGVEKKELLTIVTYELEKIHESYTGLKYDALIPCNCGNCREKTAPNFYKLETLKHFIRQRQPDIQCSVSFHMVNVRGLIDDVITPAVMLPTDQRERGGLLGMIQYAETVYVQTGTVDQRRIEVDTDGGTFVAGNVSTGRDFVGGDQNITFQQVYEAIQNHPQIKTEDKAALQNAVHDIEEELKESGEEPNEGFLKRRFRNIAAMAPDILDVALAAVTNPVAGFTEVARKIAKKAAEQAKAETGTAGK